MRKDKRRRLERAGWSVGDAGDFLNLSDDERRFIEVNWPSCACLAVACTDKRSDMRPVYF